ncbi:hypothetical protein KVV02_005372 [Mortierella alpina]|uniref:Uncharacterized protein n=1 Tax=Mortierella alpina TaxID=64518 RepID=A0A9P8A8W3_MORAP|nr:hypothetical protein KVV02_005372 [Mortierella alpina]
MPLLIPRGVQLRPSFGLAGAWNCSPQQCKLLPTQSPVPAGSFLRTYGIRSAAVGPLDHTQCLYDRGQRPDPDATRRLQDLNIRPYFYFIDVHGQVFLQETHPKNFTSCYKDPKFLDFFIRRIRPNETAHFPEYTWQSPCGKEVNFVEAADTPVVFHGLRDGQLMWAGTLKTPFLPDRLCVSESSGRLYHPLPASMTIQPTSEDNDANGLGLGLLKSSMVLSELAAGLDQDSIVWKGQRFALRRIA